MIFLDIFLGFVSKSFLMVYKSERGNNFRVMLCCMYTLATREKQIQRGWLSLLHNLVVPHLSVFFCCNIAVFKNRRLVIRHCNIVLVKFLSCNKSLVNMIIAHFMLTISSNFISLLSGFVANDFHSM